MRIAPSLIAAALTSAALASPAFAAPPLNDNYLASLPVDKVEFSATVDTTEATTQPDTFNPSRDGQPLGGGTTENTICKGTPFGKTVWYDLQPQADGAVELRATAPGFVPVVAVYEWSQANSQITRMVDCTAVAGGRLQLEVERGKSYTIQVGGVGGAGGATTLNVDYFPDTDGDGEYDPLDDCPEVAGIHASAGCPPTLPSRPRISVDYTGSGVNITRLWVERVPKGAKVVARCGGCGSQTVRAKRTGTVDLSKLAGRAVRAGASIQVRVTLGRSGKGKYRFGAIGKYTKWPVRAGALGRTLDRCLAVKTAKIERCR